MKKNLYILFIGMFILHACSNDSFQQLKEVDSVSSFSSKPNIKPSNVKHVKFVGNRNPRNIYSKNKIFFDLPAPPTIYSADYDSTGINGMKEIILGQDPLILENENKMLFTYLDWDNTATQELDNSLRIMDFSSLKVDEIYKSSGRILLPVLSKNQKMVMFFEQEYSNNVTHLKVFNLESKKDTTILDTDTLFISPSFSPDNKSIIIGIKGGIISTDLNGNNKKYLYKEDNYKFQDLSFSPDGSMLTFTKSYDNCSQFPQDKSFLNLSKINIVPFINSGIKFNNFLDINYDVNLFITPCKPDNVNKMVNETTSYFLNNKEIAFHSNLSTKKTFLNSYVKDHTMNIVSADYKKQNGKFITIKNVVDSDGYIKDDTADKSIWFIDYDRNKIVYHQSDVVYSINFDGSDNKKIL